WLPELLADRKVELRAADIFRKWQPVKAVGPVQSDQPKSRHEQPNPGACRFIQLKRIKFFITTPVAPGLRKNEPVDGSSVTCGYGVSQFQPKFIINDSSLSLPGCLFSVPGVERRRHQVDFVTPQANDRLTQHKRDNATGQPCTTHEESFERTDAVLL